MTPTNPPLARRHRTVPERAPSAFLVGDTKRREVASPGGTAAAHAERSRPPLTLSVRCSSPTTMAVQHVCHAGSPGFDWAFWDTFALAVTGAPIGRSACPPMVAAGGHMRRYVSRELGSSPVICARVRDVCGRAAQSVRQLYRTSIELVPAVLCCRSVHRLAPRARTIGHPGEGADPGRADAPALTRDHRLLVGVGGPQDGRLVERTTDDLEADRQARAGRSGPRRWPGRRPCCTARCWRAPPRRAAVPARPPSASPRRSPVGTVGDARTSPR